MASRGVKERAGCWNQEVAAASQELRRTRKAVVDVQASLAALEEEAAGGAESLKALARLHRLVEETASLAQQVAGKLQAAVGLCQSEAAQGAAARQRAATGVEAARQRESELRGEFEAARQRLDAALEGQQAAINSSTELLALQQAVEVAAEELRLLTEQQQRRRALEEVAAATAADARQQSAVCGRLAAELAACQQAQHAVAADLEQASSAAAIAALLVSQTAEERQLRAALSAAELAVSAAAAAAAATGVELAELQAEQQRGEAAAQQKSSAAQAAAVGGALQAGAQASLQQQLHQQQERLVAAQRQEQAAQLEAGTLAARLRAAVGCSGSGTAASGGTRRPLFHCFGVADPLGCQQYAEALQVLVGRKLGVVVADSTEAAAALMAAGGGTRIWPLDGLAAPDHTQQQRRAAQHFPGGQVVLPLDLLCFEEAHRPALLRAFGAHVIAASDAVAEQLVTHFGVPSATRWALTVAFLLNLAAARSVRQSVPLTVHPQRQQPRLLVPGRRTVLAVPPAAAPEAGDSAEAPMETVKGALHTCSACRAAWPDAAGYMLFCHQSWIY
ncbi:hypothetical protein D9Q98_003088 [Chlorella vulgaris]|uniref:SMC hinge domain-containing protein n=1 Tax=Chlorella vulgaris TaxID=3077 RepID=A0A9D4Z028_CHLVU|nr:hypothetical protein D9Q98_003088 [Chlorella vulgaris]